MGGRIDLTGQVFGRWTVLEYAGHNKRGNALWRCRCECGTKRAVVGYRLRRGNSNSCGCLQKELSRERLKRVTGPAHRLWLGGKKNKGSTAWANEKIGTNTAASLKHGYAPPERDPDKVVALWESSGGRCAVCGTPEEELSKSLHLDHCHRTGRLRAFLCSGCNRAYGCLREDPRIIRELLTYAEKHFIP